MIFQTKLVCITRFQKSCFTQLELSVADFGAFIQLFKTSVKFARFEVETSSHSIVQSLGVTRCGVTDGRGRGTNRSTWQAINQGSPTFYKPRSTC